ACAVIALALNTSAYSFELFRGAISAIPYGEIEACQALGLSKLQMLRKVIAPRAIRLVLPAYSNEVIIILKSTTLASTITLMDIMGVIHAFISQTYLTASYLLLAGSIYLFLNLIIINIFRYIEGRLSYQ
nr:ABC transporter permease subunit [Burkholderiales bacterium]